MKKTSVSRREFLKIAAATGVVLVGGTVTVVSGRGPNGAQIFPSPEAYIPMVRNSGNPTQTPTVTRTPSRTPVPGQTTTPGNYTNIVFMHRSVGEGMILGGNLRGLLTQKGYKFWDYFVSNSVLRDPQGNNTDINYRTPRPDATEPEDLANYFSQPYNPSPGYPDDPANTISGLLRHQIIVMKSCYTAVEHLISDQMLANYKNYSITVRNRIKQHPDHIFIHLTPPPVHPCLSYDGNSNRGRAYANWMMSSEYKADASNLFVFNLFDRLADSSNTLRSDFRESGCNSHPVYSAWDTIVPDVADFIDQSVRSYP